MNILGVAENSATSFFVDMQKPKPSTKNKYASSEQTPPTT